jgi:hypothetical protein
MKIIALSSVAASVTAAITKDDIIFIISILIVILQMVQAYLAKKKEDKAS